MDETSCRAELEEYLEWVVPIVRAMANWPDFSKAMDNLNLVWGPQRDKGEQMLRIIQNQKY